MNKTNLHDLSDGAKHLIRAHGADVALAIAYGSYRRNKDLSYMNVLRNAEGTLYEIARFVGIKLVFPPGWTPPGWTPPQEGPGDGDPFSAETSAWTAGLRRQRAEAAE